MRLVSVSLQLGFDTSTLSVNVAVAAVEEGTLLQLHLRDSSWAQQGLRDLVQVSAGLPEAVRLYHQSLHSVKAVHAAELTYIVGI